MNEMRVLVISYLFPSSQSPNCGVFVLNRIRAIGESCSVKVINPIPWFPFQSLFQRYRSHREIPRFEVIDGIEVYHPRFLSIPLTFKFVSAATYLLAVLCVAYGLRRQWKFELVDLHWTFPDLPAGRCLAWRYGLKQLVTIRGTRALHRGERGSRGWLVRHFLKKSDHVITLSERLKEQCIELGVGREKVTVIRNGVDTALFQYLPQSRCRSELSLPPNDRMILCVGYLTPHKGFDRIVRAMPSLLKRFPNTAVYIIGPSGVITAGDVRSQLERMVGELELQTKVHFVGEVPNAELVKWYNAADVFCLASRDEGSPNVLCEALACGCPAVATDVGAVPDVVTCDEMGYLVENSSTGVRKGLHRALSTSFAREEISKAARQCDWAWCARQVLEVYGEVAPPQCAPAMQVEMPTGK